MVLRQGLPAARWRSTPRPTRPFLNLIASRGALGLCTVTLAVWRCVALIGLPRESRPEAPRFYAQWGLVYARRLTAGVLRVCGSGVFSKPTERTPTASLRLLRYTQEPSSTVHVTVLPHRACPHNSAACFTGCGERSLTARAQCLHGTTVTYGSPSQTAESPHGLRDLIVSL